MVLMAPKAKIPACQDVLWEVIEVEGLFRDELKLLDCAVVESPVWLEGTNFLGEVMMTEVIEDREFFQEVRGMEGIGV